MSTDTKDESSDAPASVQDSSVIKEHIGDLFAAPDNTVLIHACNTQGSWGGGIAVEFRKRYPKAYQVYNNHCVKNYNPNTNPVPRGTCLLIAPCEVKHDAPKHWIGCLFTSAKYGKAKDPPHVILRYTSPAFQDLLLQMNLEPEIQEIRMCQINAGLFAVPWKDTKTAVEEVLTTSTVQKDIHVYTLANTPTTSKASVFRRASNSAKKVIGTPSQKGKPVLKGQSWKKQPDPKMQPATKVQATLSSFFTKDQKEL